jgi:hypothetical protein
MKFYNLEWKYLTLLKDSNAISNCKKYESRRIELFDVELESRFLQSGAQSLIMKMEQNMPQEHQTEQIMGSRATHCPPNEVPVFFLELDMVAVLSTTC